MYTNEQLTQIQTVIIPLARILPKCYLCAHGLPGTSQGKQAKEAKKVAKAEAKEAKRRKSSAKATDSTSPLHAKRELGRERSGSTNRKMVI